MLIRFISDIHSNADALEAVLAHPAGMKADTTFCLGDIVGYGAEPSKCIEIVKNTCKTIVSGNHDYGVAGKLPLTHFGDYGATAIEWTRKILSESEIEWLDNLPIDAEYEDKYLCHSFPSDPESWIYVRERAQAVVACLDKPDKICFIGHTHLPGCWTADGNYSESQKGDLSRIRLINVGSVGQARDRDPRAAYLLFDTEERTWEPHRVEYNVDSAVEKITSAGLPTWLAERLYLGN
ncbi:MAG: metallophosphoesterase family protein [FCB group bacterium]|nr:metallophosphoesterase family protein [FCB group bacterium]